MRIFGFEDWEREGFKEPAACSLSSTSFPLDIFWGLKILFSISSSFLIRAPAFI
jgi:hypothetical protein